MERKVPPRAEYGTDPKRTFSQYRGFDAVRILNKLKNVCASALGLSKIKKVECAVY